MKILFVAGTWDLENGKKSSLIEKMYKELLKKDDMKIDYYNGGNYNTLENLVNMSVNYEVVFWMVNVSNDLPKIRDIKEVNPKVMLITSKRNINNQYAFQELLQRSFKVKANLIIEFSKKDDLYQMMLFDPLGNVWYKGIDVEILVDSIIKRLTFIKNITRQSTVSDEENKGALAYFFNMFKQEMYKEDEKFKNINVPEKKEFIELVKNYANIFTEATMQTKDVKRFLGNASFRCIKGMPSFRGDDGVVFVSARNVNKEYITIDEFIPVYLDKDKLYYQGDKKPSVDTPIQVRLYDKFSNINYMIHSHCYIEGAPFTKVSLPCGAIEEVDEIYNLIETDFNGDYTKDFYLINLKGHGSIMMSKNVDNLKDIKIKGRQLPEMM